MTTFAENFEKFSDLHKQGLEPVRHFTTFAIDAFEKLARQNYAVYGDLINFAVAQARLPVNVAEPKELFERQVSESRAFVELLAERANEYVEIGNSLKDTSAKLFEAANVFDNQFIDPARKATKAAAKKAA